FAEIDRTAMQLLVQPIKQAYHLSDSSMGFLLGPAFALLYAALGLTTAWLIDFYNRKSVLAVALTLWSAGSIFCGMAQSFVQLAVARLFLGAAESPNGPAIFSILADSFPRKLLTRGIALMQLGITLGTGFSLIMTGVLIAVLMHLPPVHIAGLLVRWWQLVFIAIGVPGVIAAAVLALTVKEPARQGPGAQSKVGMGTALAYMAQHWKVFAPFMGSSAIGGLAFGVLTWTAAFYQRTYGWNGAQYGVRYGLLSLIATPVGLFLGAWIYERYVTQGRHDAAMRVVVVGRLIGLPAVLLMPLMPNGWLALAMSAINLIVLGGTGACTNSILQIISPNRMRGQITAIFFLFYNLIGQGLSPWFIGLFTDIVLKDESHLRYALLVVSLLFTPTSLFVLWLGMKPYAREVAAIAANEAPAAA
ncbi:MAG TPA: MFS transporter, partial [Caulobacteraceae bacterium]|nr:MFS transporter [Caulobacteraceae bacterium]